MKLDLLYEFQPKVKPWTLPHPYGQRQAEQLVYDEGIAQIRLADTLGFQTVWCVEHHFREYRSACPSNEVVLGALALATENIRLGFGVVLMPPGFQHPVRVAEKVATVDILSHGRVEWGTGRSTPMEQIGFGVPTNDRSRKQWREAVEFVVKAWEQEVISWDSDLIQMPPRIQDPKPFQDPHPPVWLAAASSPSAETAGRDALGLLSFAMFQPVEKMREIVDSYRNAQASAVPLTRVRNDRVAAFTLVHCTDDMEEAADYGLWDSVKWWYQSAAEFTLQWEFPHLEKEIQDTLFPYLEETRNGTIDVHRYTDEDMIIIGTPDECLKKLLRYEEVGVDHLICYMQFGMLPHDKIMRSIELLGTKVIPQLEARGHRSHYGAVLS